MSTLVAGPAQGGEVGWEFVSDGAVMPVVNLESLLAPAIGAPVALPFEDFDSAVPPLRRRAIDSVAIAARVGPYFRTVEGLIGKQTQLTHLSKIWRGVDAR